MIVKTTLEIQLQFKQAGAEDTSNTILKRFDTTIIQAVEGGQMNTL